MQDSGTWCSWLHMVTQDTRHLLSSVPQYLIRLNSKIIHKLCRIISYLSFILLKLFLVNTPSFHTEWQWTGCNLRFSSPLVYANGLMCIKLKVVSIPCHILHIYLMIKIRRLYSNRAVSFGWQCLPTLSQHSMQFRHAGRFNA